MFNWDPDKNEANKKKHRISFEDASDIFNDDYRLRYVEKREGEEERYITIGKAFLAIIRVVYVIRSKVIRIISARRTTKAERRDYLTEKFTKLSEDGNND